MKSTHAPPQHTADRNAIALLSSTMHRPLSMASPAKNKSQPHAANSTHTG